MNVLMIANTLPPHDLSGAGEQVVQLRSGLEARGITVELMGRGRGGARGPKALFPLMVVGPALWRIWRTAPAVVQLHESDGGLVALGFRLLRRCWPRTALVSLLQVSYVEERRAVRPLRDRQRGILARPVPAEQIFRWLRTPAQIVLGRITARCSQLVLVPSERTGEEVARDYRPSCPVKVLPNVTGAELEAREACGGVVRASDAGRTAPVAPYLLFVGRLRIRKGLEVLLHALKALAADLPQMRLVVAGGGEREAAIARLTRRLGLEDRVCLAGRRVRADVRELLSGAQALVVPSTYEGMPLVILEAMELGVPVVATSVSGIPEVVLDGETGWVVAPEDVEALAAALRAVWCDLDEAQRRGRLGQSRLAASFKPEHAAECWLAATRSSDIRLDVPLRGEEPRRQGRQHPSG